MSGSEPRETEWMRQRVAEEDPACGWFIGGIGLLLGVIVGLLLAGCLGSLFTGL